MNEILMRYNLLCVNGVKKAQKMSIKNKNTPMTFTNIGDSVPMIYMSMCNYTYGSVCD